ncbi:MAG TPA: FAD-dependent oxidoreductase, partial [Limnochordia bacterium]
MARRYPAAVVLPGSAEEVRAVVSALARRSIPFLARGAGTSLSGGCLPPEGAVVIGLSRLKRILEIDLRNRRAVVESGLVNAR